MNSHRPVRERQIACQQILEHDSSVFSVQWTTLPPSFAGSVDPAFLFSRYLGYVRRFTLTLVRPRLTCGGVEFGLIASRVPLLKFRGPVGGEMDGGRSLTLFIEGGVLAQPKQCDRGQLAFVVAETEAGVMVKLQLSEYCPLLLGSPRPSRLRKWLYRLTQAYIHKVVTVRFLARIYRELAGPGKKATVVKVMLRQGEET